MTRREWIAMISAAPSLQVLHGAGGAGRAGLHRQMRHL